MTPNSQYFVNYIKLKSALPLEWINNNYPANGMHKIVEFKRKMLSHIELLRPYNKTADTSLKEKSKIFPNYTTIEMVRNTSRLYLLEKSI